MPFLVAPVVIEAPVANMRSDRYGVAPGPGIWGPLRPIAVVG